MFDKIAKFFGYKIVFLLDRDGTVSKCWAKPNPFGLTCRHHGAWDVLLLPDGTFRGGPSFLIAWKKEEE